MTPEQIRSRCREVQPRFAHNYATAYATAYATGYAQAMAAQQAAAEKPKRPLGSYFIFQAERRDKVKAANPGISVRDIAAKIGEEWRALSDAQKQK
jgi:hypothetical protein